MKEDGLRHFCSKTVDILDSNTQNFNYMSFNVKLYSTVTGKAINKHTIRMYKDIPQKFDEMLFIMQWL